MNVKTVREHGNAYGSDYLKKKGDFYDLPDDQVASLVDAGLVVIDDPAAKTEKTAAPK